MNEICVFGVPLDPDERNSSIMRKCDKEERSKLAYSDPYAALSNKIRLDKRQIGNMDVESWLTPLPSLEELFMCTVENYVAFIDSDGCWEYVKLAMEFMKDNIGPSPSLMLTVDHSMAAASILHSTELYGKEDLGVIIFDSHFDGILPRFRSGLAEYDMEFNPNTRFSKNDPFILSRSDSFNADSFLYKLIDEKHILPENVMVVGVSDYPKDILTIDDERISSFVDFYQSYEEKGVKIVTKENFKTNPKSFDISSLDTKNLHVSVDIDVGSRNAIYGARFIDFKGLSEKDIYTLTGMISSAEAKVVSGDINEIDVWKAGNKFYGKKDRTYEVAAAISQQLFK